MSFLKLKIKTPYRKTDFPSKKSFGEIQFVTEMKSVSGWFIGIK